MMLPAFLALLLSSTLAYGQTDDAALRAQIEQRIERAHAAAAAATESPRAASAPSVRVDALPTPSTPAGAVDLEALAERYADAGQPVALERPTLLAMVSLSMPRGSLERLIADAEHTGATLVMRGLLNDSLRETMAVAAALIGERKVAWTIDPELFPRFGIEAVPTYVLLPAGVTPRQCGGGLCFGEDSYVRLAGDVPIAYALERIEAAAPEFAPAARHFMGRAQ